MHTVVLSDDPRVELHEDFLSVDESRALIAYAKQCKMQRSPTVGKGNDAARTSSTCFIYHRDGVIDALLSRIERLLGVSRDRCEKVQVARYAPGELYRAHHDTVANEDANWPAFERRGGHRTHTVLLYLNDVHAGGETRFPTLSINVVPVRGRALVFRPSVDGRIDRRLLHEAAPLATAEKWVCQVWVRERRAV